MAHTPDEPLTLTVHSLPRLDSASVRDGASSPATRWMTRALLLVSAAPVIAAYVAYFGPRLEARHNHGELITPQRPLPNLDAVDARGQVVPLPTLRHQWLLISVTLGECDEACQKRLFLQRQLRETLGQDKRRLDAVWLVVGNGPSTAALPQLAGAAQVLRVDGAQLAQWLQPAAGQQLQDHLYLVDPMGHWMLRFPAQIDPRKAQADLERLLRASAPWDAAGRPDPQPRP